MLAGLFHALIQTAAEFLSRPFWRKPSKGITTECRHLDGNSANGALANLIYGTKQQNADDRVRHGRSGKGDTRSEKQRKITDEQAMYAYKMRNQKLARELAKELECSKELISAIWNKRVRKHLFNKAS